MTKNNDQKDPITLLWQICSFLMVGATLLILPAFMILIWWNLKLNIIWGLASIVVLISVAWWGWTIRVILQLAKMRNTEKHTIDDILSQLSNIREEISKTLFK